ncbi:MAG: PQQ-dependent sugar dehydrogenase [Candidatus Kerfeldbacteria bacterium]|nr:PQQ-dependent sugar dehydrogenase [Candidatus Kerfeldbacteria bacterium]
MKKKIVIVTVVVTLILAGVGGYYYWRYFRGVGPSIKLPPQDITKVINTTGMPLTLPAGFRIDIVAKGLDGARVLRFDAGGQLWVSQPKLGQVTRLTLQDGRESARQAVIQGLSKPHGLAFHRDRPHDLYVAAENAIWKYEIGSNVPPRKLIDLPVGGNHTSRTIGFGPDHRLYVAIGSTCNVCLESDPHRAAIWTMERDGSDFRLFASGLRNTVFFTWHEGQLWGTDMGRDFLGDDLPPDEINIIEAGKFYGWPFCYGQNVHDRRFDGSAAAAARCVSAGPSRVDIPAHSAPLGLAFVPPGFGHTDWVGDLLIAYHGSWNRTAPTGYKLVRYDVDQQQIADFATGWLTPDGALGRPVDLVFHGPALYVSDDKAGVIYRLTFQVDNSRP